VELNAKYNSRVTRKRYGARSSRVAISLVTKWYTPLKFLSKEIKDRAHQRIQADQGQSASMAPGAPAPAIGPEATRAFIALMVVWVALWVVNKVIGVLRDADESAESRYPRVGPDYGNIVSPHWRAHREECVAANATNAATAPPRRTPRLLAPAAPPALSTAGRGSTDRANPSRYQRAPEARPRQHVVVDADLRPRRVDNRHAHPDSCGEPREDRHVASAAATSVSLNQSSLRPDCSLPAQPLLLCPPRRAALTRHQMDVIQYELLGPNSSPDGSPIGGDPSIASRSGVDMDTLWEDHGWSKDGKEDHIMMRPQVGRGRTEPNMSCSPRGAAAAARAERQAKKLSSQWQGATRRLSPGEIRPT